MRKLRRIAPLSKGEQITWWVCRAALFIWGVWGMLHGYTSEFIQATFAIIFTHLWDMFQMFGGKSFITRVTYQARTMLNLFICFGVVIGYVLNTKTNFPYVDIIEHFISGVVASYFAYDFAVAFQGRSRHLSPGLASLFALCFSCFILVGWEFYEFTMDRLYGFTMQHGQIPYSYGLTDTMIDLIVGTAGALVAMFIEAFRRVGIIGGKGRHERRAKYKAERAEVKAEKMRQKALEEGRLGEV
jgi:hypothetical protein